MSQNEKLKKRVLSIPTDLTYTEFVRFMNMHGYIEDDSGSGSRVKFYKKVGDDILVLSMHKPHGNSGPKLKQYAIKQAIDFLKMHEEL